MEKNNLDLLREEIDAIDTELIELFKRRLGTAGRIAEYKKANGLPVADEKREMKVLEKIAEKAGAEYAEYAQELYRTMFRVCREYESRGM
ncbi:MAG: chorismate mutase [Eubacteriaceae bacterium]|jgi:monofunctional chorismate mutase|nr:chorismate mutase [Eubacteriaceae bacterium]